jgi:hypothetical protein
MDERDTIISQFIDDELTLDEKAAFLGRCRESRVFIQDCLALVEQEATLRMGLPLPSRNAAAAPRPARRGWLLPVAAALALAAALGIPAAFLAGRGRPGPSGGSLPASHRFILYEPAAGKVEIAGSFTDWRRLSLDPLPGSGYWEITLPVPQGSQSYVYILDGTRRILDPTVQESESDDFGGRNSILLPSEPSL